VDEFLSDDEQAERTKNWLRENSVFIVAGVVIGLGSLFGWQQWEDYNLQKSGDASVVWEQLSDAIDGQRFNEVQETVALLEADYADTPYLDQARLALARMHMDRNEPDLAVEQLEMLSRAGGDKQLQRVAELRLAQVLLHMQRYEDALAALGDKDSTAFAGQFHNIRGDVYFAQGRLDDARMEYLTALAATGTGSLDRTYVQMKLDDVSGSLAANERAPEVDESASATGETEVSVPDSAGAEDAEVSE